MLPKPQKVFLPFALAYFLSYFYRVANAVIGPHLAAEMQIGPAELGFLTATYFIAFASFQLPLGFLLDRFGPRKVETVLLLLAGAGALTFGLAQGLFGLSLGRALIGWGVSAGYMAAIKAYTLWFQGRQWPTVNGWHLAFGGLGVLTATLPLELALQAIGWRGIFFLLSFLTGTVAAIIFRVVPEKEPPGGKEGATPLFQGLAEIFSSPLFWRVAPFAALSQATAMSLQGLWSGPWLRDVAGMDRQQAAEVLLWTALSMTAGFLIIGVVTEKLAAQKIPPLSTAMIGMIGFLSAQLFLLILPGRWAVPLWMLFGFLGTSGSVLYPAMARFFPVRLTGRISTGLNLLVFLTTFCLQWGMGVVIGAFPSPGPGYAVLGYQTAFGLVLILQTAGLLWYFLAGRFLSFSTDPKR